MNAGDIIAGIRHSWDFLKLSEIGQIFSNPAPMSASDEFKAIASDPRAKYEEVYLVGLRDTQYNFVLEDYSFIQIGGVSDNTLRYAYYPNPFLGSSTAAIVELAELREFVEEGAIDVDEFLHLVAELRSTQHPPLLRYENSSEQYQDLIHPCSHFHFGHHADNRWPVRRILTPHAFTLIVIKHFYSDKWQGAGKIRRGKTRLSLDDLMALEKPNCRLLPDDLFSATAGRHFHFA